MLTRLSAPICMQWELTPWCPNTCVHCYNYWRSDSNSSLMFRPEDHTVHEAAANEIVANKVFHVTLTGGEPLAAIRQYAPYLAKVRDAGTVFNLNSTLIMLTPSLADLLHELRIETALVSVISANAELHNAIAQNTGAFQKTMAGIALAQSKGIRVSINMVVTKKNLHTVRETGQLAKELGAVMFSATKAAAPANCPDFTPYRLEVHEFHQMLRDLLWVHEECGIKVDSLEHYAACSFPDDETRSMFGSRSCLAGKTVATIGFDGKIRPCSHAHLVYGNVVSGGIKAAWDAMSEWGEEAMVPQVCKTSCAAYASQTCGGGCRTDAYATCGSMTAPDPYCQQESPTTTMRKKEPQVIADGASFRLAAIVQHRPESFGHILYRSASKWTAVNDNLFQLVLASREGKPFLVGDVAGLYGVEEERAVKTIRHLLSRKLLDIC